MKSWPRIVLVGLCVGALVGPLLSAADARTAPHEKAKPHEKATPHKKATPGKKVTGTETPCGELQPSPATWMRDLAPCLQNRPLSRIVIPGSHDSATYGLAPPDTDTWHAQNEDLTAQLNGGIREFDIRVEYECCTNDYYAHHGSWPFDGVSNWLTLSRIFSDIEQWALAPGHEQEVILLNLSIGQNSGPFPTQECQALGRALGGFTSAGWTTGALVTPWELQSYLGTTDPGKVTLGQLWSLPDPSGAARVIMDNYICNREAADALPSVPDWGPFLPAGQPLYSGYYADQCTADGDGDPGSDQDMGVKAGVLEAASIRATLGNGSEPIPPGSPKVGGVWLLGIGGTPEADCLRTPWEMVPDERGP